MKLVGLYASRPISDMIPITTDTVATYNDYRPCLYLRMSI